MITQPPPPELLSWLTHSGPLTQRLRNKAGVARMEVLGETWEAPDLWDKETLALDAAQRVLHREIVMRAMTSSPCWYARTILPDTTYQADSAFFDRLKTEPLGKLVFGEPRVTRTTLTHYTITPQHAEYHWLPLSEQTSDILWMRLSSFKFKQHFPFFLAEILLPELERYAH